LILAGDMLFAGGDDLIAAYSISDGTRLWQASVAGKAHGLVVANGRLFVSTDKGKIYCFTGN
jgi:outer membrane protein assembly factor BamB